MSGASAPLPVYQTLSELVESTPLILIGRVHTIAKGRTAGEGDGSLQFHDVTIEIERVFKGHVTDEIVVEQVAGADHVLGSEVGPAYRVGERYALFLRLRPDRRAITVRQGRYRLTAASVEALGFGPVSQSLQGLSEEELVGKIQQSIKMP